MSTEIKKTDILEVEYYELAILDFQRRVLYRFSNIGDYIFTELVIPLWDRRSLNEVFLAEFKKIIAESRKMYKGTKVEEILKEYEWLFDIEECRIHEMKLMRI